MSIGKRFRDFMGGMAIMAAAAGAVEAKPKPMGEGKDQSGMEHVEKSSEDTMIQQVIDQAIAGCDVKNPKALEAAKRIMHENFQQDDLKNPREYVEAQTESLRRVLVEKGHIEPQLPKGAPSWEHMAKTANSQNSLLVESTATSDAVSGSGVEQVHAPEAGKGGVLVEDGYLMTPLSNASNLSLMKSRLGTYADTNGYKIDIGDAQVVQGDNGEMYVRTKIQN